MTTFVRDPLNESLEASEQPYFSENERERLAGAMTGEVAALMTRLKKFYNDSHDELAKALGVHQTTVDHWFAGETHPNDNTVMRARKLAMMRGLSEEQKAEPNKE